MAKPQSNRHKAKPCSLSPGRLNIWWLCTSPHNTMSARRSWPTSVSCLIEIAPEGNPQAMGMPTRSEARPHGRLTLRTEKQILEHRQEGQGHSTVLSRPERDFPPIRRKPGHPRARSPGSQERGAVLEPLQWPEQQQRHSPFARCSWPSQEETGSRSRRNSRPAMPASADGTGGPAADPAGVGHSTGQMHCKRQQEKDRRRDPASPRSESYIRPCVLATLKPHCFPLPRHCRGQ